jgi:hypothetical protein
MEVSLFQSEQHQIKLMVDVVKYVIILAPPIRNSNRVLFRYYCCDLGCIAINLQLED